MNALLALAFLFGAIGVQALCLALLEKHHDKQESTRHKIGRYLFHASIVLEVSSLLLVAFTFLLSVYVHNMPLDWARMHGFWKRGAPLLFPSVLSLLVALCGVPFAGLGLAFSFRMRRAGVLLALLALNYFIQARFVHWLAD